MESIRCSFQLTNTSKCDFEARLNMLRFDCIFMDQVIEPLPVRRSPWFASENLENPRNILTDF
jgi:hypothetical protein